MKRELKHRSAIEPMIRHAKNDSKPGRNDLLGNAGNKKGRKSHLPEIRFLAPTPFPFQNLTKLVDKVKVQ